MAMVREQLDKTQRKILDSYEANRKKRENKNKRCCRKYGWKKGNHLDLDG